MDERVLGDMPSEGSEGGRRFGIYRASSPEPKMHSISRIRLIFVLTIVVVVAFAVFFPMIQYASRGQKHSHSLPYPEIANRSLRNENISRSNSPNCSTNVLSFGLDCTGYEPDLVGNESNNVKIPDEILQYNVRTTNIDTNMNATKYEEDMTEIQLDLAETRNMKFDRTGRSRWPVVSTPYPYYSIPKPTPLANDRNVLDFSEQTNIFAIPLDMSTDNFSDYYNPRPNFTPPPYAFTPYPNFTDSYAQLSPYKIPKNYTNLEEIMKFLNNNEESKSSPSTERSENVLNSRKTMMKVSGTYVMPLDRRRPGEIIVSDAENTEEARPFFNGHAYVTDPFLKFRPANPLEINRLIPIRSSVDLGPRFRKPVSFVPSASVPVDLYSPLPSADDDFATAAGSHTVAIFHPPPPLTNYQRPTTPPSKDKPLSVTLDIYPVTMTSESEVSSMSSTTPGRVRGRLNPNWRPKITERPRWRPQVSRRPSSLGAAKSSDNHMIVHLNLFPNKRKPYTFPRRGKFESTTQQDPKVTFLPGSQFSLRSIEESPNQDPTNEVESRGTTDSTTIKSDGVTPHPEYLALSAIEVSETNTTTSVNNFDENNLQNRNHNLITNHNISTSKELNGTGTSDGMRSEEHSFFSALEDVGAVGVEEQSSEGVEEDVETVGKKVDDKIYEGLVRANATETETFSNAATSVNSEQILQTGVTDEV